MKPAVILPILAALALAAPPLDPWLDRSMARHMLLQVPLLLLLGFAVGAQVRAKAGMIVVGPTTAALVRDQISLRTLGPVALKGKSESIEAFEVPPEAS